MVAYSASCFSFCVVGPFLVGGEGTLGFSLRVVTLPWRLEVVPAAAMWMHLARLCGSGQSSGGISCTVGFVVVNSEEGEKVHRWYGSLTFSGRGPTYFPAPP